MPRADSTIQPFNHSTIAVLNRQRTKKINSRRFKEIAEALLAELQITEVELGINLVGAREMALVNETFLQHEGPTDVITFDHSKFGIRECGSRIGIARRAVHLRGRRDGTGERIQDKLAGGNCPLSSSTAFCICSAMTI